MMKSSQEQQQPSSMESNDSAGGSSCNSNSDYAYRPLTTKHRRAGSTGTTGDEDYTSDEDEFFGDDLDCATNGLHAPHPILKSDLARAATDLFGYADETESRAEPTSLFDDDDVKDGMKFGCESTTKPISYFSSINDGLMSRGYLSRRRSCNSVLNNKANVNAKTFDLNNKKSGLNLPNKPIITQQNNHTSETTSSSPSSSSFKATFENCKKSLDRRLNEDVEKIAEDDDTSKTLISCSNDTTQDLHKTINSTTHKDTPESQRSPDANVSSSEDVAEPSTPSLESQVTTSNDPTTTENQTIITKLQKGLQKAEVELKLKDEEVNRLSRIRQDVEAELEELTASLFQEAHNMVHEANARRANAEKLLEESRMKVEVLAAEVAALKTLVLTSTPARPNPHLHPQIASGCSGTDDNNHVFGKSKGQHRRSPSHFTLKYAREISPPDSPQRNSPLTVTSSLNGIIADNSQHHEHCESDHHHHHRFCGNGETTKDRKRGESQQAQRPEKEVTKDLGLEVDPRVHAEFLRWKANPCVDKSEPFIERIFKEDIDLCLDFPNGELGFKVRQAVLDGIIFVEAVNDKARLSFPKKCALLEAPRHCQYRMRLGDQENQWFCISQICRNRIIAVCDFLNYLRYIERGLVKSSVHDIYWEITRLRKEMVLARLGLALSA